MTNTPTPRQRRRWPFVAGAAALAAAMTLTLTPANAALDDLLTSPNGSRFELTVTDDGALGTKRVSGPTPTTPPVTTPPTTTPPASAAPSIAYAGAWQKAGTDTFTTVAGARATITFTGTALSVTGIRDAHHANATVTVDGRQVHATSSKGTPRAETTIFSISGLTQAQHTVVITSTGTLSITGAKLGGTTPPTTTPPTTAPPTSAPPTSTPPTTGIAKLSVSGNDIQANGRDTWFLGYNSFTMGGGCGTAAEVAAAARDAKPFIDSMRRDGHGILRLFYWKHYGADTKAALQELVNYAGARNVYTILTLSDGQRGCGDSGPGNLSADGYAHVREAATRFRDNNAVAFFEVANEPTNADWNAGYLDKVRGTVSTIRSVDSDRLVGSGNQAAYFLGGGDAESKSRQRQVNALVDIASMHDYEGGCDASRTREELQLAGGKPLIMGEFGITDSGSFNTRPDVFACKIRTWAGYDGFAAALGWAWQPGNGGSASEYGNLDADTKTQTVLRTATLG